MDEQQKSPVIVLPEDEARREQLRQKLEEYRTRIEPHKAPEMQMDTICKIAVLERLLRDSQVNTWDLSREMVEIYGPGLDAHTFNVACGVVADYIKTGGANLHGGTGLK